MPTSFASKAIAPPIFCAERGEDDFGVGQSIARSLSRFGFRRRDHRQSRPAESPVPRADRGHAGVCARRTPVSINVASQLRSCSARRPDSAASRKRPCSCRANSSARARSVRDACRRRASAIRRPARRPPFVDQRRDTRRNDRRSSPPRWSPADARDRTAVSPTATPMRRVPKSKARMVPARARALLQSPPRRHACPTASDRREKSIPSSFIAADRRISAGWANSTSASASTVSHAFCAISCSS